MMDLVERLRDAKDDVALKSGMPYALLLMEAADEIERLRVVGSWDNKLNAIMAELKAMHERIKNAGI